MVFKIKAKSSLIIPYRSSLSRLWPYKYEDRSSWPYVDCVIGGGADKPIVLRWIENPKFKYKHLMRKRICG